MLEAEQSMHSGNTGLVFRDSVQCRQDACTIINSVWGLNMWELPSEPVLNMDTNGDNMVGNEESSYGTQYEGGNESNVEDRE